MLSSLLRNCSHVFILCISFGSMWISNSGKFGESPKISWSDFNEKYFFNKARNTLLKPSYFETLVYDVEAGNKRMVNAATSSKTTQTELWTRYNTEDFSDKGHIELLCRSEIFPVHWKLNDKPGFVLKSIPEARWSYSTLKTFFFSLMKIRKNAILGKTVTFRCISKSKPAIVEHVVLNFSSSKLNRTTIPQMSSLCHQNSCGRRADCVVLNFEPYCVCQPGVTGDPYNIKNGCDNTFSHKSLTRIGKNSCSQQSCVSRGAACININGHIVCYCGAGYIGKYPSCKQLISPSKVMCRKNSDCEQSQEFCDEITHTCQKVCTGEHRKAHCGENLPCEVMNHKPICHCAKISDFQLSRKRTRSRIKPDTVIPFNYTFSSKRKLMVENYNAVSALCKKKSCGKNAIFGLRNYFNGFKTFCFCPTGYSGNPEKYCSKISSSPKMKTEQVVGVASKVSSCFSRKNCGRWALCVKKAMGKFSSVSKCECLPGYIGDPMRSCWPVIFKNDAKDSENKTCRSCGPNSLCHIYNERVHCRCNKLSIGIPPKCYYLANYIEQSLFGSSTHHYSSDSTSGFCIFDTDCVKGVCQRNRCIPNIWGCKNCSENAQCVSLDNIKNSVGFGQGTSSYRCECRQGFQGNPYNGRCTKKHSNPCHENRICGPNSICRIHGEYEFPQAEERDPIIECYCLDGHNGNPYSFSGCKLIDHPKVSDEDEYVKLMYGDQSKINHKKNDSYHKYYDKNVNDCKSLSCGENSVCFSINGWPHCACNEDSTGQPPNCRLLSPRRLR